MPGRRHAEAVRQHRGPLFEIEVARIDAPAPCDLVGVRQVAICLALEIDERAEMLRQFDTADDVDLVALAQDVHVRAGQLEAALPRAQVEDIEGRVRDRVMAARQAIERHRFVLVVRPLQCRLADQSDAAVGSDHEAEPRPYERHSRDLDPAIPDRAGNREADAAGFRGDERLVARLRQDARAAKNDLGAVTADAGMDGIELQRESRRLAHALDDALLVARQEVDRQAECPDPQREQERREADERGNPAPQSLHPMGPGAHAGSPDNLTRAWTRAAEDGVPAIHGTCQRRTPAASRSAAVSNSGRPITPEKLPSRRAMKTAPSPWMA